MSKRTRTNCTAILPLIITIHRDWHKYNDRPWDEHCHTPTANSTNLNQKTTLNHRKVRKPQFPREPNKNEVTPCNESDTSQHKRSTPSVPFTGRPEKETKMHGPRVDKGRGWTSRRTARETRAKLFRQVSNERAPQLAALSSSMHLVAGMYRCIRGLQPCRWERGGRR